MEVSGFVALYMLNKFKLTKPDGRPLYQYRISTKGLDQFEAKLLEVRCSDQNRINYLAPLASARFAANYQGGPDSWEDCGKIINDMRKKDIGRFTSLMRSSFDFWGIIPVVNIAGNTEWLDTIAANAGIPSPMLREGSSLRSLLLKLMAAAARGEDVRDESKEIVRENQYIPARYKQSNFFSDLCAEMVVAVLQLKNTSGWSGGVLDPVWEVNDWFNQLPVRVSEDEAKAIVASLLEAAENEIRNEPFRINRFIKRLGAGWQLGANVQQWGGNREFEKTSAPIVRFTLGVNDEPVQEMCRMARQRDGSYKASFVQPDAYQFPKGMATSESQLSILASSTDGVVLIDVIGGEKLDEDIPWVFDAKDVNDFSKIKNADLIGTGSMRTPAKQVLIAIPAGWNIVGNGQEQNELDPIIENHDQFPHKIKLATGIIDLIRGEDRCRIITGYDGPQALLHLTGSISEIRSKGFTNVFKGVPTAVKKGIPNGRIEWKHVCESSTWRNDLRSAQGAVQYRLIDSEGAVIAQRRALILPANSSITFQPEACRIKLGDDFLIDGIQDNNGEWKIPYNNQSIIRLQMSCPGVSTNHKLQLELTRPPTRSAFISAIDRSEVKGKQRNIDMLTARSFTDWNVYIKRHENIAETSWAWPLREGSRGRELPLLELSSFIKDLTYDWPRSIEISFLNGPKLRYSPKRFHIDADQINCKECESVLLRSYNPFEMQGINEVLKKDETDSFWIIPENLPSGNFVLSDLSNNDKNVTELLNYDFNKFDNHESELNPIYGINIVATNEAIAVDKKTFTRIDSFSKNEEIERLEPYFDQLLAAPNDVGNYAELTKISEWFENFSDLPVESNLPMQSLARNGRRAIRFLCHEYICNSKRESGKVNPSTKAELALIWGLGKIPMFWHQIVSSDWHGLELWITENYGNELSEKVISHLCEIQLKSMLVGKIHDVDFMELQADWRIKLERPSTSAPEIAMLKSNQKSMLDAWDNSVQDMLVQMATNRQQPITLKHIESQIASYNNDSLMISERIANFEHQLSAYYIAPRLAAAMVAANNRFDRGLRDELAYVRRLINVGETFDNAFFYSLLIMERTE